MINRKQNPAVRQKIKPVVQALSDRGSFLQLHQVSSCQALGLSCCPSDTESTAELRGHLASLATAGMCPTGTGCPWPGAVRQTDGCNTTCKCKNKWGPDLAFPKQDNPFVKATPILLGRVRMCAQEQPGSSRTGLCACWISDFCCFKIPGI